VTPIRAGTWVEIDETATFLGREFISGGAPWRLLRLRGGSRAVVERWKLGAAVQPGEEGLARTLVQQGLLHPRYRSSPRPDDVDVIIPVKDDVDALQAVLEQLRGLHVTVVDDGSVDPLSIAECANEFAAAVVRLDKNMGPGAARNAGVRATERPLVCFVDVDVRFDNARDLLDRLSAHFQDPLLAASAPRIRGSAGPSLRDRFEVRFSPLDMGPHSGLVVPGGPIGYVPSACLLVRRDAFAEGFDEQLRQGEDVDLVWRLHDQGWLVRYWAEGVVTHRARGSWRQWLKQRVDYGSSAGQLANRHGDRLAPLRSDPWTLVAWSSVLLGKPMIGARVVRVMRDQLRTRIGEQGDDVSDVVDEVVSRGMLRAGGPMARAVVRTFGLGLLVAALHPRLRRRALLLFAVGTAWRWRHEQFHASDVPLALADDAAYGLGVMKGAWRSRSMVALTPKISKSSVRLRDMMKAPTPRVALRSE